MASPHPTREQIVQILAIAFGLASTMALAFCLPFAAMLPFIIDDPAMLDEGHNTVIAYFEIATPFVAAATLGLAFKSYREPTIRWALCLLGPATVWSVALAVAVTDGLKT